MLVCHVKGGRRLHSFVRLGEILAEGAQVLRFGDDSGTTNIFFIVLIDSLERDRIFTLLLFAGGGFRCLLALCLLLEQLHKLELVEALAKVRIVSVLDCVVGATLNFLGNVTPSIPMDQVQLDNEQVLLHGPLALANGWVQVIVPALTTLLSNAPG